MVRVWNFLLPESGEHSLKVEHIGMPEQRVTLDGVVLESRVGQTTFPGPESSLLRFKSQEALTNENGWVLLVNERFVEEAAAHGNGLRDLRSLPDGSYIIATGFDADSNMQNIVRRYSFLVDADPQEIAVAHHECVWQVSLNGSMVDQERHTLRENEGHAKFEIKAASGAQVPVHLEMAWALKDMSWIYRLRVGNVLVPACWTKAGGHVKGVVPPTVTSGAPQTTQEMPELRDLPTKPPPPASEVNSPEPENLPQGVSYDKEAGAFQANIKDAKANRFIFLGEYPSADAAHQKYIEALAKYAPEKRLAPLAA